MLDTEKTVLQANTEKGSALAEKAGESFLLAITAAYMAGMEAGKQAAQNVA